VLQYSLTLALEELGFPTLHTQHLYEHEKVFGMWIDEVFQPSIDQGHSSLRKPNLQLVADHGFQATCDLPMALYYEQIMEEFPDCRFILTTRSNSEEWFRSWDTLTKSISQPARFGNIVPAVRPIMIYLRWLFAMVNKDDSYLSLPYPLPDQVKGASIASYEEHNRKVRATIPPDRLLEYNVKDGWDPLCKFMAIENCPQTPFPKTNSARSVRVQAISSFMVPFSLIFFLVSWLFVKVFRRLMGTTPIQYCSWRCRLLQRKVRSALNGGDACPQKSS
jgi:Sulfotransferase domain